MDLPTPDTKGFKSGIDRAWRKERPSPYNSSKYAKEAYEKLLSTINARYILTSYSTDGNIEAGDLLKANLERGRRDFINAGCTALSREVNSVSLSVRVC